MRRSFLVPMPVEEGNLFGYRRLLVFQYGSEQGIRIGIYEGNILAFNCLSLRESCMPLLRCDKFLH